MGVHQLASATLAIAVLAGCTAPTLEPPEGAAAKKAVDLAEVAGVATKGARGAYLYHSAEYNGSWTAFRLAVPPEAVLRDPDRGQFPHYAPVHLVVAFLEDGRVVEASRPSTPREADATGPIAFTMGFFPIDGGRAAEAFARIEPTLAATYANLSVEETPQGMPTEVLLVVGAMPRVAEPRALEMAVALQVGGMAPAFAAADWDAALAWMAADGRGEALTPLATGDGLALSVYQEFPASDAAAAGSRARAVAVRDTTGSGGPGLAGAERRLEVTATRALSSGRTYAAAVYQGAADVGAWAWRYDPPGEANFSDAHAWAGVTDHMAHASVFAVRDEARGPFEFGASFSAKATALPEIVVLLLTTGVDLQAVWGRDGLDIGPTSPGTLPKPVDDALKSLLSD